LRSRFVGGYLVPHKQPIDQKAQAERHEPRVGIELIEKAGIRNSATWGDSGPHKTWHNRKD
jgi:hypothetical protein